VLPKDPQENSFYLLLLLLLEASLAVGTTQRHHPLQLFIKSLLDLGQNLQTAV